VGTKLKQVQASEATLAAVASVAEALGDGGQVGDVSDVAGFDRLPPKLQDTLKRMGKDELKALGKLQKALRQDGLLAETETDSVSLTMF
jgi:hypothetical protein